MKAQGMFNHWRGEANRLPAPTMEGEWCIAPGGTRFRVTGCRLHFNSNVTHLSWELCTRSGTPLGILFRETVIPDVR